MSSLIIGLNITDSNVTSALVRLEHFPHKKSNIERDTYCSRSLEINTDTDPRDIISIWIECINDILTDFVKHYRDHEKITGIAIGVGGPMDYKSAVSYNQLSKFRKFFGINLRLALENGLRQLVSTWKYDYYDKYHENTTVIIPRKQTVLDKLREEIPQKITVTPPTTPRVPFIFNILPPSIEKNPERTLTKDSNSYCGQHDNEYDDQPTDAEGLPVYRSRLQTYLHDIDAISTKEAIKSEQFNSNLWSIIENISRLPISFYDDNSCFGLGEADNDYNRRYERVLALTLDNDFRSVFINRGHVITDRDDVPPNGALSDCPYDQYSTAGDWFSIRGLIQIYKKILRKELIEESSSVSETASSTNEQVPSYDDNQFDVDENILMEYALIGDPNAIKTFQTFSRLLGAFLIPYIDKFQAQLIVVGGPLVQVWTLIEDELSLAIQKFSPVNIYFSLSSGRSICLGAAQFQYREQYTKISNDSCRLTHQNLLPTVKSINTSKYDIYPTHSIPNGHIGIGHEALNEKLHRLIEDSNVLLIEGFVGTYFNEYAYELNKHYVAKNKAITNKSALIFYDSKALLKANPTKNYDAYLNDSKTLFGSPASNLALLHDFIDADKLKLLKDNLSYPCVIIGPGSSFVNDTSPLIYIDLPKCELTYRVAARSSSSYLKPARKQSTSTSQFSPAMYEQKCLRVLDYPVFNKLKYELLPRMNYFVDGQRPRCPTWIDGDTFRQTLASIAKGPIRARPWFESSPWGGQWLKTVCTNLPKHAKNYAWSFEMIPSQNGLILSDNKKRMIELSWDIFYGSQASKILGNDVHCRLFSGSNDFPMRFNILDTMDGGNQPIYCNPSLQYMHENFGEKMPQDEAFYVIETKSHWKKDDVSDSATKSYVYLGFHENINREEFLQTLIHSQTNQKEINIDQYVQCLATDVHDFFLIPNQTIHGSGRNQVVLEISSAPDIYTFKLYDWLRSGANNRPCMLNIEDGIKNLQFNRYGEQLRCQPVTVKIEKDRYEEQHLPTHDLHIYDLKRIIIEPDENIEIIESTDKRCHLCMLVQGDAIEIKCNSTNGNNNQEQHSQQFNYIETFLIPASVNEYRLRPILRHKTDETKPSKFVLLIAFLKWNCDELFQ